MIENKLDKFIDILSHIGKTLKDKDNIINGLKTKIDTIELKIKEMLDEKDKVIIDLVEKVRNLEIQMFDVEGFDLYSR